jgi:hypothetical protein
MATVTIDAVNYDVYADVATATSYLNASLSSSAAAFRAASADDKARSLVMATRWIDAQNWAGEKANPAQALDWPRTGIDGLDDSVVPPEIIAASIELAAMLTENPALITEISSGGAAEVKSLKAGSASIEYFKSLSSFRMTQRLFPPGIYALLSGWLVGATGDTVAGSQSYDTCEPSRFHSFGFTDGF